MMNKALYWLF